MGAATNPLFATVELLEEILLYTTPQTILTCIRVSTTFRDTIYGSKPLQKKIFLLTELDANYEKNHKDLLATAHKRTIIPWRHNASKSQRDVDTIDLNPLVSNYLWPHALPVKLTSKSPLPLVYQNSASEFLRLENTSAMRMYLTDQPCTIDLRISRSTSKACGGDVLVTLGHCRLGEIVAVCKAVKTCFAKCKEGEIEAAKSRGQWHELLDGESEEMLRKHDGRIVRFY
ncbi:hypothetical protein AC579_2606 [Pseudocercospora musae]|uniref:Uncharacterized protein n=1 Tax=Pseudocercospora musae TaxID=113226 RepID=A0A139I1J2_9PEZI|nr:hypothetical protein AC579_2606 [Pseudocercospora musae]